MTEKLVDNLRDYPGVIETGYQIKPVVPRGRNEKVLNVRVNRSLDDVVWLEGLMSTIRRLARDTSYDRAYIASDLGGERWLDLGAPS